MDDRKALLMEWLEGEWERQHRPMLPSPQVKDPALRGWIHVAVCVLGAALGSALFVCWLVTAWHKSNLVTGMEKLRLVGFRSLSADPNWPELPPASWNWREATTRGKGSVLAVFLCIRLFALALGTLIGAVFLCVACAFYNHLAGGKGSPTSVPEPLLSKAIGIIFVTGLADAVVGRQLLAFPVCLVVMAGMNSALLPTTFARGLLVALCYLLVGLIVVVVLAVSIVGFFLVVYIIP
jgi:hypothetical protein